METREKSEFDQVEICRPEGEPAAAESLRVSWHGAGIADHFVQFYRDDSFLADSVADFIGSGLRRVEGGIVIATAEHLRAVEERLEKSEIDLQDACARRQYVPLDAEEVLDRIMVSGMPDEALFIHVVGGAVTRMVSSGYRVRAFGEMVALLWADGNSRAALQLERFWNNLAKRRRFALFCAYPMAHFERGADDEGFRCICAEHSGYIPVEGIQDGPDGGDSRVLTGCLSSGGAHPRFVL